MRTMNELFLHFLQDIYYAEKASAKSVSKLMKAVQNDQVRELLKNAKEHSHEPIERLDHVFEAVGKRPRGKTCEAMNGLLAECQEAIEEGEPGPVLDAALIACMQGMKMYEITRYGSLLAFARQMGLEQAMEHLEALRDAARADDETLSEIAESHANAEASETNDEDDEEEDEEEDEEAGEEAKGGAKAKPARRTAAKRKA